MLQVNDLIGSYTSIKLGINNIYLLYILYTIITISSYLTL